MPITVLLSNTSEKPIYAQITDRIRAAILSGEAMPGEELPSIRALAQDLRVSVITTRRAFEDLEREGFIVTRAGIGSFVAEPNREFIREARLREMESLVGQAIERAKAGGMGKSEVKRMVDLLWTGE